MERLCLHSSFMNNKCTQCNLSITNCGDPVTVPFSYIHPELSLTLEEINRIRDVNLQYLLNRKKLHLVLDLDHTLVNTTKINKPMSKEERENIESLDDVYMTDDGEYLVKLRPGVREFLKQVSSMFTLSIYTRGRRDYAHHVLEKLEAEVTFSWVIAREDCVRYKQKVLDIVLSHGRVVLIVDDTKRVWCESGMENLIRIRPYEFTPGEDEAKDDKDEELARVFDLLTKVHSIFYDDKFEHGEMEYDKRDVRKVLKICGVTNASYVV